MKPIDLSGRRFSRLVVVKRSGTKHAQALWLCRCDCGKETKVIGCMLRSGRTRSCGCFRGESTRNRFTVHGMSNTSTYAIWTEMLRRCENQDCKDFSGYGGRGITVCDRWHSFEHFLFDMGERPHAMQLERNDNSLGYSPENCRWATRREQMRNMRSNVILEYRGEKRCLCDWADLLGIPRATAQNRYYRGKSVEEILMK